MTVRKHRPAFMGYAQREKGRGVGVTDEIAWIPDGDQ